jgi:UDP-N-acetyl-D-glucosamine dehydrogenase
VNEKTIAIHGLGYVGLTSAVAFAQAGWVVIGYDPDAATVRALNAGTPRAGEFLSYLNVSVAQLVREGRLRATTDWSEAVWASVQLVAVPTERDGEPYDEIVLNVLRRMVRECTPGTTILVESTLTPGTIDKLIAESPADPPFAETCDLRLAVCPRRDWLCDRDKNLATLPRIVGGVTPACTERAVEILSAVSRRIIRTTYRTAELTKALENALLHLPVMLCHQLAAALPEHNVAEAIKLASTHWRFASLGPLYIGMGAGGRCIPLGPRYLIEAADRNRDQRITHPTLPLGQAAVDADDEAREAIARVVAANGCRSAAVLGIAYRPEFRDAGRSPGLGVARALVERDIAVHVADPMWTVDELATLTGLPVLNVADPASKHPSAFDAVLLATPHEVYHDWPLRESLWRPGQLVIDGQGTWAPYRERLRDYGVDYRQVGMAGWMRGKTA